MFFIIFFFFGGGGGGGGGLIHYYDALLYESCNTITQLINCELVSHTDEKLSDNSFFFSNGKLAILFSFFSTALSISIKCHPSLSLLAFL